MKRSTLSRSLRFCLASATAVTASLAATSALAQAAPESADPAVQAEDRVTRLDDVVVTARRRVENLRDVPVVVVPITPEELQKNVTTDLNKVGEVAPQVVIGRGVNGTGALITMRGISSTQADAGVDQSVAVVVDGVPLSRGRIISTSLFDLQQVEVMQGPQALFFGKNSPAGVISLTSATPGEELEGSVRVGYELEANERYLEAMMSTPLTDTIGLRVALRGSSMDGWIENVAAPTDNPFQSTPQLPGAWEGTMPGSRDIGARVVLSWTPSETFDAALRLMHHQQDVNSNAAYSETFCVGSTTSPTQLGVPMPGADCEVNRRVSFSALPAELAVNTPLFNGGTPFAESDFSFASLEMNWYAERYSITSTTGLYDQTVAGAHGADFSPFTQIFNAEREHYRVLTQEVRLNTDLGGPFDFMVGAYGERSTRHWRGAANVSNAYNPVRQNYTTAEPASDNDSDSISAFFQARWAITPDLELTAGARYSKDEKKSRIWNQSVNLESGTGRTLLPEGRVLTPEIENTDVSPEVALTWKPSRDQTFYGAYKTGYKAGGIANSVFVPSSATDDSVKFDNEEVKGFEIGYRADFLDRTLRVDLTAYDYDYEGLQVTSYDVLLFRFRVLNAAGARTTGITGSFKWLATDNFSLHGNFGYNRGRYVDFTGAQCYTGQTLEEGCVAGSQDLSGRDMNRAPRLTANLGVDYRLDLGGWTADLFASAGYSSSYQTAPDYDPSGLQSAFWRFGAGVHLMPASERFRVSLIGRNLGDESYLVYGFSHAGTGNREQYIGTFNRPREIVLEASYRF